MTEQKTGEADVTVMWEVEFVDGSVTHWWSHEKWDTTKIREEIKKDGRCGAGLAVKSVSRVCKRCGNMLSYEGMA